MFHYTYLLEFKDGMKYVGVHSTHIKPELDSIYLGSGRALPERNPTTCVKKILGIYATREAAIEAESSYIITNDCCNSNEYYNIRVKSHDRHGVTKETCAGTRRAAEKLTGRTFTMSPSSANNLKGDNRTPAQKAGALSMRCKLTGIKNPAKGRNSTKNHGFNPWYYISPTGEYKEVYNETKQEFAKRHNCDPQSVVNRCRKGAEHVRAIKGKWAGWMFGNLV